MRLQTYGQQLPMEGQESAPVKRNVFDRPFGDIRLIVEQAQRPCDFCGKARLPRQRPYANTGRTGRGFMERYNSPWDDAPDVEFYCSEECRDQSEDSGWSDFFWEYCDGCNRYICYRNPSNGWMGQFRMVNDCELVCLRCYEESVLADGQPEEDFTGDVIKGGMFFNRGNPELVDAGYECLKEAFIGGGDAALAYNQEACRYIEQGYQLVTAFESMAIGGMEGSIELWGKRKEE